MEWYCKHCKTEQGQQCPFRDKELKTGPALVTNAGKAGAWYIDEEIDTRPTAVFYWKDVQAYACNLPQGRCCPVSGKYNPTEEENRQHEEELFRKWQKKREEDSERFKRQCAERTISYAGVTYKSSYELEMLLHNGSEEEFIAALQHATVISRGQAV